MSAADRAERTLSRYGYDTSELPRLGDGVVRQVSLLQSYSELIAVSLARAEFLGNLLAAQVRAADARADRGHDTDEEEVEIGGGLVGHTYTATVVQDGRDASHLERLATGEEIRALTKLEADERDRASKLLRDAVRLGVEIHAAEAMRTYGTSVAATLQALVRELGLDEHNEIVQRAAKRAVYLGRRATGQDEGDPDLKVGPPLSHDDRARALAPAPIR